ncbi:MAG: hypothetical protein ACM3Q2_10440 [Syntrophothermus sp.]
MERILVLSLYLTVILYNITLSQADSAKWSKLIKQHKNIEIIYNDYITNNWILLYSTPQVFIDTIAVLNISDLDRPPTTMIS